jgi:hypothetical protein
MPSMNIYKKYLVTTGIIWAACFVLFCLAYMIVLRPQKGNEQRLANRLAEKKQLYESVLKAAQQETRIQMNEQIRHLQEGLGDFVVDFEDSANLTFDISQMATEKEVASFSVKSRGGQDTSAIPNCIHICESNIDIGFSAGFNQFAAFLNAMERHKPVLFIDTFVVTRSKQDGPGYQVSLNVAALVRKQQDSDTAGKSPVQTQGAKI